MKVFVLIVRSSSHLSYSVLCLNEYHIIIVLQLQNPACNAEKEGKVLEWNRMAHVAHAEI